MKKCIKYIVIFLLLAKGLSTNAQSIIEHFTVADGLPSEEVYYVHQDNFGYIWFCTDRGLSRYDGVEFTNFSTADGLTHNTVFKIFEDKNSNLWITCLDGSITIFDRGTSKFKPFEHNKRLQLKYRFQHWTHSIGFRGDNQYFFMLSNNIVDSIYHFKKSAHIESLSYENFVQQDNYKFDNFHLIDKRKESDKVIYLIVKTTNPQFNREDFILKTNNSFTKLGDVPNLIEFENRLFLGQENGAYELKKDGEFYPIFKDIHATSIIIDRQNTMWVTTLNSGIYSLASSELHIKQKELLLAKNEKLFQGKELGNKMLLVTDKGRFLLIDSTHTTTKTFYSKQVNGAGKLFYNKDSSSLILYDVELKKQNQELSFFKTEYNRMEYPDFKIHFHGEVFTNNSKYNETLTWGNVIGERSRSYSLKLLDFIIKNDIYKEYIQLSPRGVIGEYYFTDSSVYLANNNGLVKLFANKKPPEIVNLGISENTLGIKDLDVLDDFIILSTKGYGIQVVKNEKVVSNISLSDGLLSDMVNSSWIDKKNSIIWCGTNRGISVFAFEEKDSLILFHHKFDITTYDGLFSNYINYITPYGEEIYAISNLGFTVIPKNYKKEAAVSMIVNKTWLVQGDSTYASDSITFSYDQNNLEFHYVAISTKHVDNMYRHRLIASHDTGEWNRTDNTSVRINNLAPCNYTFEICARAADSEWSIPVSYTFTITPRFIDRLWVRLVAIILLGLIAYYYINLRIKRIKASATLENALQELKLKNVELESSSLRGQMNPHFIFNVLNSIQKFILKEEKNNASKLLTQFSSLIRSSLKHSRLELITLEEEIAFLDNYISIETQRFPDRFAYAIEIDNNLKDEGIKIPPLLIQPLCENAIKHAFVEGKGSLKVSLILKDEKTIHIEVLDDGIGILNTQKRSEDSIGLQVIQDRLNLFKNEGFDVDLTLEAGDKKTKKGTRAILIIPYK